MMQVRNNRTGRFCRWPGSVVTFAAACALLLSPVRAASESDMTAESISSAETVERPDISGHIRGIGDFSIIEGMNPDVMAGIEWDDTVEEVVADTSDVDFSEIGEQTLTYTVAFSDGKTERRQVTVTVYANLEMYLYGMEGAVKISPGESFDPLQHIVYEEQIEQVTADTSSLNTDVPGDYLIPYILTAPDGRTQTIMRKITVIDGTETDSAEDGRETGTYSTVTDLGLWRLTAYMDTPEDQGPYVGKTASGAPLVAGRTVAVSAATCSRLGLEFGDRLMIDGHIYVLEDHGGSAMNNQNWVDIFVDSAVDAYSEKYNRYSEVYLLR